MTPTTRPPASAGTTGARQAGAVTLAAALSAPLGAMIAPKLGVSPGDGALIVSAGFGALAWATGAIGSAARDTIHFRESKMLPTNYLIRLAATLFMLPLVVAV